MGRNNGQRGWRWDCIGPLAAILALGGLVRLYGIGAKGLWLDEAFSIWMARHPLADMLGWVARIDQHPPLYYILLHGWLALGDGEAQVRALSALCSVLTIPVIYLLGRRLGDHATGLLAALLLAVSPFHVHYAQEARMYALLGLEAALVMLALAHLLTDPQARTRSAEASGGRTGGLRRGFAWLGYTVFTAAALLTHSTAVFLWLAANLVVGGLWLAERRRGRASEPPAEQRMRAPGLPSWALAQVGVLALWAGWLPALSRQALGVYREFWLPPPTLGAVIGALGAFASEFFPLHGPASAVLALFYVPLFALGCRRLRRRPSRLVFLAVLLATPVVGELVVSVWRPIFYDRTLIWASPPFYLFLAAGIRQLRRWPAALVAVFVALAINGLSLRAYYRDFEKEGWEQAAALVAARVDPDDLILFHATWVQIPFDYYFQRAYNQSVAEHGVPADLFDQGTLEPAMTVHDQPRLRALIRPYARVWLVYSHDWYTDPVGRIPAVLADERLLLDVWEFKGVQVRLYGGG